MIEELGLSDRTPCGSLVVDMGFAEEARTLREKILARRWSVRRREDLSSYFGQPLFGKGFPAHLRFKSVS